MTSIEVDDKVFEMEYKSGIKFEKDNIDVTTLSGSAVMISVPFAYDKDKHDDQLCEIYNTFWKSAWDPENMILSPEDGEWTTGLSVESCLSRYTSWLMDSVFDSSSAGYSQYLGVDIPGACKTSESCDDISVLCTISSERLAKAFRGGLFSSSFNKDAFIKKYKEWCDTHRVPAVDLSSPNLSDSSLLDVHPDAWGLMFSCLSFYKSDEQLFSRFLQENEKELADMVFAVSPSDMAAAEEVEASEER